MTEEEFAKHSLLLTHGTIYGLLADSIEWVNFTGRPVGIDIWNTTPQIFATIPYGASPADHPLGLVTNNAPIDVVSWYAGPGDIKLTGLEIWQQCMSLLMRHI